MHCNNCGNEIDEKDKFCSHCGKINKVENDKVKLNFKKNSSFTCYLHCYIINCSIFFSA